MRIPNKLVLFVAVSLLILLGLYAGAYAALSHWAGTRLDEELQRLHARGESIDIANFVPPPVSDELNGAVLYEKAESLLVGGYEGHLTAYVEMRENFAEVSLENVRKVEEWLEMNRDCMALLEQGLAKSHFRVNANYSDPFNKVLANVDTNLQCTSLFICKALIEARAGHREEAFEACRQSMRLSRTMSTTPFVLSVMNFGACVHRSLECLDLLLDLFTPTPEECEALLAELDLLDPFDHSNRALQGERCLGYAAFEFMKGSPSMEVYEESARQYGLDVSFFSFFGYPEPLLMLEQAWYLGEVARIQEELRTPWRATDRENNWDAVDFETPWYCLPDHDFLWVLDSLIATAELFAAHVDLHRLTLSLILHHHKHRDLPDTLAGLEGEIMESIPLDPYTGSPFLYRKRPDGGFVLYSVGTNRIDDQGVPGEHYASEQGDMVQTWAPKRR